MYMLKKLTVMRRIDFCRLIGSKIKSSGSVSPTRARSSSSNNNEMQCNRVVIEPLLERELVRVDGEEVVPFLQGLITNDMNNLKVGPQHYPLTESASNTKLSSMYTLFLNKTGRVLYDSIIYRDTKPNTYFIECDKVIAKELRRHLRLYRVRRKINIDDVGQEYRPWIAFSPEDDTNVLIDTVRLEGDINLANDPRVRGLGTRLITTADKTYSDLAEAFSKNGDLTVVTNAAKFNYRSHRYRYGIGEGVVDLPPGKCFPFEANCDFLHGVSFNKGCYIGQELTARVYHTGVIRKRIMPLRLTTPIPAGVSTVQTEAGKKVGTIRGSSGNRALALLRVEQVINAPKLLIDGEPCYAEKPNWWPRELSTKHANISEGY